MHEKKRSSSFENSSPKPVATFFSEVSYSFQPDPQEFPCFVKQLRKFAFDEKTLPFAENIALQIHLNATLTRKAFG